MSRMVWRASMPWLIGLLSCALCMMGCEQGSQDDEPAAPPLSVATWNLNWLNEHDEQGLTPRAAEHYEALARYARQLDADVVIVQEIDGEAAARRIFDPVTYAYHISSRDNVQRVGIVYKRGLRVTRHPDLVELARVHSERLRYGVDLSVYQGDREIRLLGVHLKSGCFSSPLKGPYAPGEREDACLKLGTQMPVITRWMARRAEARTPFMVVGDFNRRLRPGDEVWEMMVREIPGAGLSVPTMLAPSRCWQGRYPELIDHVVMDYRATLVLGTPRMFQLVYEEEDAARHGYKLSDHCPVGVRQQIDIDPSS